MKVMTMISFLCVVIVINVDFSILIELELLLKHYSYHPWMNKINIYVGGT